MLAGVREKDGDARQRSTPDPAVADGRRRRLHDGTGHLDVSTFRYLSRRFFSSFLFPHRAIEGEPSGFTRGYL